MIELPPETRVWVDGFGASTLGAIREQTPKDLDEREATIMVAAAILEVGGVPA